MLCVTLRVWNICRHRHKSYNKDSNTRVEAEFCAARVQNTSRASNRNENTTDFSLSNEQ